MRKVQALELSDRFPSNISILKLLDAQRSEREKKLTVVECYDSRETCETNSTPDNKGLVAEFYLVSWPVSGKHLVITLLETKGKDEKA